MEISPEEQIEIKRTIIKETLDECIDVINNEIETSKSRAKEMELKISVSEFNHYIDGLESAKNIINEVKYFIDL